MMGCLSALVAGIAVAGDMKAEGADPMEAMMKCRVCQHLAPHLEVLGPAMTMDVARLNDGVALMHGVTDPEVLPTYREVSAKMNEAAESCMAMSDEEASANLCEMCQEIRGAVNAGAHLSMGDTRMGDMMVITSEDPALQQKLHKIGDQCEMMMQAM